MRSLFCAAVVRLPVCLAGLALLFVVALSGCGGASSQGGEGVSGNVQVDGSSTVFPITEAVAEEFMQAHRGARVNVGMSGTGGGFAKFIRGETDITDASRPISEEELQRVRQNNLEFIELPIAYDGLAVVVNRQNDWVECLTVEELRQIWEPGSDVDQWSDIRSEFPDRPISLYGPGTSSGTYDYFTEAVVGEGGKSRTDFTASEDDNVLVQGVEGDPNALGFFGYAYFQGSRERLKVIGVDGGDGCVEPSVETVKNGAYQPLSRPLFIYSRLERANENPTVAEFIRFYISEADTLAQQVGYIPLSPTEYDLVMQRFENRNTGTMFTTEGAETDVTLRSLEQMLREHGGGRTAAADTTRA